MDLSNPPPTHRPPPSPPAPQARREDPRLSGTWLRFYARTPAGALRLWVQAPLAACSGTGAAIALDDCNDLLQEIDHWLAADLDWCWADAEASDGAVLARAQCAPFGDPGRACFDQCRLEVPWPLMRHGGPPPPPLASRLRWQGTPAQLSISRQCLDDAELSDLESGGIVVLPESMEANWRGRLHLPDDPPSQGCAVDLATPGWPRQPSPGIDLHEPPHADGGARNICSVRLVIPAPVPAPLLTGWPASEVRLADFATGSAELWLGESGSGMQARLVASGRLVPWGRGCGMLIDERL